MGFFGHLVAFGLNSVHFLFRQEEGTHTNTRTHTHTHTRTPASTHEHKQHVSSHLLARALSSRTPSQQAQDLLNLYSTQKRPFFGSKKEQIQQQQTHKLTQLKASKQASRSIQHMSPSLPLSHSPFLTPPPCLSSPYLHPLHPLLSAPLPTPKSSVISAVCYSLYSCRSRS